MNQNRTYVSKAMSLIIFLSLSFIISEAQTSSPKLRFVNPTLFSGIDGQQGTIYKFTDVISGVDAYTKIEELVNGAYLSNIDESSIGYPDAWQPTVGGPGTIGRSYIKWSLEFKTTAGDVYSFSTMDLSAIDIDGDNAKIKEFVQVNGEANYDLPPSTLLQISTVPGDNYDGDDISAHNLEALGRVDNKAGIDTTADDVRITFHFLNKSKIKVITGSDVVDNGYTGPGAPNRYTSLYFKNISFASSGPLPVNFSSFSAAVTNNLVSLHWITGMESVNDHYEIQRSYNKNDYKTLSSISHPQSANGVLGLYDYKDLLSDPSAPQVIYYRIKRVDNYGKVSYSDVKAIHITAGISPLVQVFPNPYINMLNVSFPSDSKGDAEVRLVNVSGQTVVKKTASIDKGYNNISLSNLNTLSQGIYTIHILVNGELVSSQKVVKN